MYFGVSSGFRCLDLCILGGLQVLGVLNFVFWYFGFAVTHAHVFVNCLHRIRRNALCGPIPKTKIGKCGIIGLRKTLTCFSIRCHTHACSCEQLAPHPTHRIMRTHPKNKLTKCGIIGLRKNDLGILDSLSHTRLLL